MAKSKSSQFSILRGVLDEHESEDENKIAVLAAMDARKEVVNEQTGETRPATLNDWTLELNGVEAELGDVKKAESALNVRKKALQRLIGRHLQANNLQAVSSNGYTYSEKFLPVASVANKAELRQWMLKNGFEDLLTVHSGTLNTFVTEAVTKAMDEAASAGTDETLAALAALGVEPGDDRGKENLNSSEGAREAFLEIVERIVPAGVKANARISLSRTKSSR
jgi:hypothetical protein